MLKKILLLLTLLTSTQSFAALNECIGVNVGVISIANTGMNKVFFLPSSSSSSGNSFWVYFNGWSDDARKEALSVLMAAKLSQHPVDIYTTATDACSIGSPGQVLKEVHISMAR